jgi:hypothetical protein
MRGLQFVYHQRSRQRYVLVSFNSRPAKGIVYHFKNQNGNYLGSGKFNKQKI